MNNKKHRYVRPQARDLSAMSVSGQGCATGDGVIGPMGQCITGTALTSDTCAGGSTPPGGNCAPTGGQPQQGYCDVGGLATEGCWPTGSIHH